MNQSLYPQYCEPTFFAYFLEPINTLSNIAFLISGFFIYQMLVKNKIKDRAYWFLCGLILFVGIGSILWHAYKTPFTLFLDAFPIYLFMLTSLFLLLKKTTQCTKLSLITLVCFVILQILLTILFPKDFLNGSIRHVANILMLVVLTTILYKKYRKQTLEIIPIIIVYILAVFFRSIDLSICSEFKVGTHFLWHILNGINLFLVVRFLLRLKN